MVTEEELKNYIKNKDYYTLDNIVLTLRDKSDFDLIINNQDFVNNLPLMINLMQNPCCKDEYVEKIKNKTSKQEIKDKADEILEYKRHLIEKKIKEKENNMGIDDIFNGNTTPETGNAVVGDSVFDDDDDDNIGHGASEISEDDAKVESPSEN